MQTRHRVCVLGAVSAFVGLMPVTGSQLGLDSRVHAQAAPAKPAPAAGASPAAAQKLVNVYLTLQRKLAADDHKAAQAAFVQLKAAAEAADLSGDAELRKKLSSAAAAGASAKDIEADRSAFGKLSEAMLEWLKREGNPLASSVRVAHCPMAMNGKGARWVQTESKVGNPYYGSEMLECGSIEREVPPGGKLK
jgi:Cu(I)/Ag(I) efflux system membrane fusion protein